MKTFGILPARLDSQRLPRKMLLDETGMALIEHTYRNVERQFVTKLSDVIVATPDAEIEEYCHRYNMNVVRTGPTLCGSHCCMVAAESLGQPCNIINIQGDYPQIEAKLLPQLALHMYKTAEMASAYYITDDPEHAAKASNVTVVTNRKGYAQYFSRSRIPYDPKEWKIHVGVYAFPYLRWKSILMDYHNTSAYSQRWGTESGENLEQLLWLDDGEPIMMFKTEKCVGIDTREDYDRFKQCHLGG